MLRGARWLGWWWERKVARMIRMAGIPSIAKVARDTRVWQGQGYKSVARPGIQEYGKARDTRVWQGQGYKSVARLARVAQVAGMVVSKVGRVVKVAMVVRMAKVGREVVLNMAKVENAVRLAREGMVAKLVRVATVDRVVVGGGGGGGGG